MLTREHAHQRLRGAIEADPQYPLAQFNLGNLYDEQGREFVDGCGSLWYANVGYGREEIVAAVAEQMRRLPAWIAVVVVAALATLAVALYMRKPGIRPPIDSLAVLPFVNASHDPQSEFLADGMTETIINKLAELPQLRVMSRTTMFRYKGKNADPQHVGRELKVSAVLAGRVLQLGQKLDIQTELVNVNDGSQLWGERYQRTLSDVFGLQDDIAREPGPDTHHPLVAGPVLEADLQLSHGDTSPLSERVLGQ